MTDLADAIAGQADSLAQQSLAAMYDRNPFWGARFGERGRRFAAQDARYHVDYLVEALRAESPETLATYARWLQGVLTTRGMCSRHLAENFRTLAAAINTAGIAEPGLALDYLERAEQALNYDGGAARAVQDAAPELAERVAAALLARHPDWAAHWDADGPTSLRGELQYLLSYLADSLALGRPDLFAAHLGWTAGYLADRGVPPEYLPAALGGLDDVLGTLPAPAGAAARAMLAAARGQAVEQPAPARRAGG